MTWIVHLHDGAAKQLKAIPSDPAGNAPRGAAEGKGLQGPLPQGIGPLSYYLQADLFDEHRGSARRATPQRENLSTTSCHFRNYLASTTWHHLAYLEYRNRYQFFPVSALCGRSSRQDAQINGRLYVRVDSQNRKSSRREANHCPFGDRFRNGANSNGATPPSGSILGPTFETLKALI
jgi:hypothetical protein